MDNTECGNCVWADIADKPRKIVSGGTILYQPPGSVICTCSNIKEISITDSGMRCSSYKESKM